MQTKEILTQNIDLIYRQQVYHDQYTVHYERYLMSIEDMRGYILHTTDPSYFAPTAVTSNREREEINWYRKLLHSTTREREEVESKVARIDAEISDIITGAMRGES